MVREDMDQSDLYAGVSHDVANPAGDRVRVSTWCGEAKRLLDDHAGR
jgi:hypothetical protein